MLSPRLHRLIFPKPNTAGTISNGQAINNYTYTAPNINPFTKFFGRLDYNVTPTNKLNGSVTEGNNPGKNFGWGDCPIGCQSGDVSRINSSGDGRVEHQLARDQRGAVGLYQPA